MGSIRPITLRRLISLLRLLMLRSPQSIGELKYSLSFSESRLRELLHELRRLNLISVSGNQVEITGLGRDFVKAYEVGNASFIHNVLMGLETYRKVYMQYISGVTRPQDIHARTGLNMVTIDVVLRLVKELNSLSKASTIKSTNKEALPRREAEASGIDLRTFTLKLIEYYKRLTRRLGSRYIPLSIIKRDLAVDLGVSLEESEDLLRKFIRTFTDFVSLSPPSPYMEGKYRGMGLLTFNGRKYAFIMIDVKGVLSCLK